MRTKDDLTTELDLYIGKRLRSQRLKLGKTLSQLAKYLEVSLQQVQKYEQGQSRIPATVIYKLAHYLGVSPSYFFEHFEQYNKDFLPQTEGKISSTSSQCFQVCLVEDDPADEMMIREIFESSHIKTKIMKFHDGEMVVEFLKNLRSHQFFKRPDIILLDLNLPKKNGHQVLKDIKRDPNLKDIPVIILTNSINSSDLMKSYQNFASGYICKSFDYDVFERKLHRVLDYWSESVVLSRHCSAS